MARVPLIDPDDHPELTEIAERIRGRRRGNVINVYRTLLHSPPLAESWFEHINRVRWGTDLDGRLRELVIIRMGYLVNSAYVLRQHVPKLAAGEGISEAECEALKDWRKSDSFDARERAALAYVDAMTLSTAIPDEAFTPLRAHFSNRQIVELTVMIGAYLSHSRVLQALEVDLEPDDNVGV
jgi:alkylhydroperoxidase family enzyme